MGAVNLVHPHPIPWENVMQPIQKALNLEIVRYDVWLDRLKCASGSGNLKEIPALKLLDFYESFGATSNTEMGIGGVTGLKLDVNETLALSRTLSTLETSPLQDHDVDKWLKSWALID